MTFCSSPRRYRPRRWSDVLGQDVIVSILKNEILAHKIGGAYLFCGQRGVGKTTLARIFARAINCENIDKISGDPCGECSCCSKDSFFEIDAASNNSVDDIRNITEQVRYGNSFGGYNVFIIDEVHMLTQAAFNAFLKTLEEPPQKTVFILATTEQQKVPATIMSRCQCFNFQRIPIQDIVTQISKVLKEKGIGYENQALEIIAEKADGSLRDALSILDGVIAFCVGEDIKESSVRSMLNILDEEYFFLLCNKFLYGEISDVILCFHEVLSKGFSMQSFLEGLLNHFMYLLLSREETTRVLLNFSEDKKERYSQQSLLFTIDSLQKIVESINMDVVNYKMSPNKKFFIEMMLWKINIFSSSSGE